MLGWLLCWRPHKWMRNPRPSPWLSALSLPTHDMTYTQFDIYIHTTDTWARKESPSKQHSTLPVQDEKQLIIQQRREDMNCKNTEFYFRSWPHWIRTESEIRRTQWSFCPIVFSQKQVLFPDIAKFTNNRMNHRLLSINNQIHVFPLTCRFGPWSVGAALNVRASFDQGFYDLMLCDRQTPVGNTGLFIVTG